MADAKQAGPTFYDKVKAMAEEMGLEGDDKDNYINQSMEKKGGFRKVIQWVPEGTGDDKNKGNGSSWF